MSAAVTPAQPAPPHQDAQPHGHWPLSLSEEGRVAEGRGGGRAVSARNATTHGLFARDVVLPALGEDPAAFDALLVQLCTQLPPRNILERHYLEQIAAASWRLRRLHRWQAQVYEDATIDEDQRLDKLDKTLRHETALTRQIDRAVRLLRHDLSDLFAGRAREDTLAKLGRTEAECHATPGLAAQVERIARRAVQATADEPPLIDGLDPVRLDNVHAPTPNADCENEPAASPHTVGAQGPAPTADAPAAAQKCENELPADGWAIAPNLPFRGDPAKQGREVSCREAYRGEASQDGRRKSRSRART